MQQRNYSKFEKVRLLAARRLQISQGAPPLVDVPRGTNPSVIAQLEYEAGLIPIEVRKKED